MSIIVVGTNTFVNCAAPLAIDNTPTVVIEPDERGALAVTIAVESPPARVAVHVERNRSLTDGVDVTARPDDVQIRRGDQRITSVQRVGPVIHLEFDFRPLGLQVYADERALHVGSGRFSGNTINAMRVGINLATDRQGSGAGPHR